MTGSWVSGADQWRWQRQAAAELAAILDAHPDLPPITWTVGPAGSVLAGQVNGLAAAMRVREVFDAWQLALMLADHREDRLRAGGVWLHATARRHGVKVRLTATVFDGGHDDDAAVTW